MGCESVHRELLQAASTWGWAGSVWLGLLSRSKPLQTGERYWVQGEGGSLPSSLLLPPPPTSSRTIFSWLFQLSSVEAVNTRGRNRRVKLRPALGPAAPKPCKGASWLCLGGRV